jgi:DNA-binding transcriptional LysR family regulator
VLCRQAAESEAGQRVFEHADRIFRLYDEMEGSVRELTGDISGVLMLGASMTVAEYMLPALLGGFKRQYPEVRIRLKVANTDGIVSMVEDNEIDLGVVEAPVANKNLAVELCRADQLVVVVPPQHELAQRETVAVAELINYPYICRKEGSGTREVVQEYLKAAGLTLSELDTVMELGSPEAIKGAVEANMGISVLSRATIIKELNLGSLKGIPLEPALERPYSFVHQKQKFRVRAVEELLNFARTYCSTHQNSDY